MAITVSFKVLAQGYSIEGERGGSPRAVVSFLTSWADAFSFYNQVLGTYSSVTIGPVSFSVAYAFPASPNLYAVRARIEPCGADGTTSMTHMGLAPGEFFTHARITVDFEQPGYRQTPSDDPGNLNQLDPANPITLCDQEVEIGGKMQSIAAGGLAFDGSPAEPALGDFAKVVPEARLVLNFPRIPFLPWQLIVSKGYIGSLNDDTFLLCSRGTLLFEGMRSRSTATTQGTMGQSASMNFAYDPNGWNTANKADGTPELLHYKYDTSKRPYNYMNFNDLLLTYNET